MYVRYKLARTCTLRRCDVILRYYFAVMSSNIGRINSYCFFDVSRQ